MPFSLKPPQVFAVALTKHFQADLDIFSVMRLPVLEKSPCTAPLSHHRCHSFDSGMFKLCKVIIHPSTLPGILFGHRTYNKLLMGSAPNLPSHTPARWSHTSHAAAASWPPLLRLCWAAFFSGAQPDWLPFQSRAHTTAHFS